MIATRMQEPSARRKNVPLSERDLADLQRLQSDSPQRDALLAAIGYVPVSEAAVLRAVFELGLSVLDETVEREGYARLAAAYRETEPARREVREQRLRRRVEDGSWD